MHYFAAYCSLCIMGREFMTKPIRLSKREVHDYAEQICKVVLAQGESLPDGTRYAWEIKPTNVMLVFAQTSGKIIAWSAMFADKRIVYRLPPDTMKLATTPRDFVPVEDHIRAIKDAKRFFIQRDYDDGWILL
jgi:hypothetical protein